MVKCGDCALHQGCMDDGRIPQSIDALFEERGECEDFIPIEES